MQREKKDNKNSLLAVFLNYCMRKGIIYNKNQYDDTDAVGIVKKVGITRRDQKS